ncbi:MAG: DUF1599 domain-containing protein [Bacteroides sp.]|nr:DUF1599 domain-containing protein [Bacteroides sp.]
MNKSEQFRKITAEMADLYEKKNADYGDSFTQSVDEFGFVAGLVRMSDKFNRAKRLLLVQQGQYIKDESVMDTLTDLANYAIMLRMEVEARQCRDAAGNVVAPPYQEKRITF